MLEQFVYENHKGVRFEGLKHRCFLNHNTLRDYAWETQQINNRIARFKMGLTTRSIPIVFYGATEGETVAAMNRLYSIVDADIAAKLPGKVWINGQYTPGWITGSKKTDYLINKRLCRMELTLASDDPMWYTEKLYVFPAGAGNADKVDYGLGVDYPHDYAHDYALSVVGKAVQCDTAGAAAFRIKIYGEATNPAVVIAGHVYSINATIGKGETLLIDSASKTITLTTANGVKVNMFDARNRDSYIFEPIPPGRSVASRQGTFGFDLTLIEKRSEPRWT